MINCVESRKLMSQTAGLSLSMLTVTNRMDRGVVYSIIVCNAEQSLCVCVTLQKKIIEAVYV
jgi:hypothetical protein